MSFVMWRNSSPVFDVRNYESAELWRGTGHFILYEMIMAEFPGRPFRPLRQYLLHYFYAFTHFQVLPPVPTEAEDHERRRLGLLGARVAPNSALADAIGLWAISALDRMVRFQRKHYFLYLKQAIGAVEARRRAMEEFPYGRESRSHIIRRLALKQPESMITDVVGVRSPGS